jgi:hypothetical protein
MQEIDDSTSNPFERTTFNYWREFQGRLTETLKTLKGLILVIYSGLEFIDIVEILNKIEPHRIINVLYVSLVRSYGYIRQVLEYKPCTLNFFVVDCVSGYAFPQESDIDECFYHKPPSSLEEMKRILKFGIEKCNPDMIVIDSLSQFINYSHPTTDKIEELYSFLRTLKAPTNEQETVVLLYDEEMRRLHRLPKESVDEIIRIEKRRETREEPLVLNRFG